jgi:membrane protein DedA with SNARE-associated domain
MDIGATIVLGIVGSFVGGFIGYVIFHKDATRRLLPAIRLDRIDHRRGHRATNPAGTPR